MKRPKPDTRLDWRDPQMPVLLQTTNGVIEVTPDVAQATFQSRIVQLEQMERTTHPFINWRNDPTYNLRKRK